MHARLRPRLLSLILLSASLSGCSTKVYVLNLSEYPPLPGKRLTHLMRATVECNPYLRRRALWGHYGGPGDVGGVPVDAMDEIFRQHDLAYLRGTTRADLHAADRALVARLKAIDPSPLSPDAAAFRSRAIRYFQRPISRVIGKPIDAMFGYKKWSNLIDTSPPGGEVAE